MEGGMEATGRIVAGTSFQSVLLAADRHPAMAAVDDLYGWFVGRWDLDVIAHDDEGRVIESAGEAHCARVLEGRAVQDVFINPRRSDRRADSPRFANWFGTTLRIHDPSIGAWRVHWFNPEDGFRAELIGRRRGHDIVQEGTFADGTPIRWTFDEIEHASFRWRGERLEPDGRTWRLQVEMRARRVI